MSALVEFLRARLDEDEQTAREANTSPEMVTGIPRSYAEAPIARHIARFADPARVLREVEAKREIVNYESNGHLRGLHIDAWGIWRDQLKSLAAVHADHPDYQQEWRP